MQNDLSLSAKAISRLSDRHFGIGGDGVILIKGSGVADGRMEMYNADGSPGNMCGNGVRCVGKFLYDRGYAQGRAVTVETKSGIKTLQMLVEDGRAVGASVDMGQAVLENQLIPVLYSGGNVDIPVTVSGETYRATCVSMGNPHAVVFHNDVASLNLASIGPLFERNILFPEGVNTEFVRVVSGRELEMRVWERGSGETLACGTGACASVVAAALKGFCRRGVPVKVRLLGGSLEITCSADYGITMTGDAVEVFSGAVDIPE